MKVIYATAAMLAGLAAADTVPYPTPTLLRTSVAKSKATQINNAINSDLSSLEASITAQPEFTQFTSALASAVGSSEWSALINSEADNFELMRIFPSDSVPTWWTRLPSSAQAYATSFYGAEISIYNSEASKAAAAVATPPPVLRAAAVVGAGAIAGAALLL